VTDIIRIFLTGVLLIFVWLGHDWALYLAVTVIAVAIEGLSYQIGRLIKLFDTLIDNIMGGKKDEENV